MKESRLQKKRGRSQMWWRLQAKPRRRDYHLTCPKEIKKGRRGNKGGKDEGEKEESPFQGRKNGSVACRAQRIVRFHHRGNKQLRGGKSSGRTGKLASYGAREGSVQEFVRNCGEMKKGRCRKKQLKTHMGGKGKSNFEKSTF